MALPISAPNERYSRELLVYFEAGKRPESDTGRTPGLKASPYSHSLTSGENFWWYTARFPVAYVQSFIPPAPNEHNYISLGLVPAPPSDGTLIRRAYLDLVGLLPDPAEVDAFVNDPSPRAYEGLVDRLLASPNYGERWGRHWLDLVRYADSWSTFTTTITRTRGVIAITSSEPLTRTNRTTSSSSNNWRGTNSNKSRMTV